MQLSHYSSAPPAAGTGHRGHRAFGSVDIQQVQDISVCVYVILKHDSNILLGTELFGFVDTAG